MVDTVTPQPAPATGPPPARPGPARLGAIPVADPALPPGALPAAAPVHRRDRPGAALAGGAGDAYSFQNYGLPQTDGAAPVQWVGLGNFTATFADPEFWLALRITVLFAAAAVSLTLLAGTLVGLC